VRFAAILLSITPLLLQGRVNFKRDVRPILAVHCVRCHGAKLAAKGLRLHTKQRAMMAIEPRNPENSRAFLAAKSGYMPPPGPRKLTDRELEVFRRWILEGAKWPKDFEIQEEEASH
jgi:mono/diheme cytochrome c family protein